MRELGGKAAALDGAGNGQGAGGFAGNERDGSARGDKGGGPMRGGPMGGGPMRGGPMRGGPMGGGPMRGGPVEKPKDFAGTWARFIRYCRADLPAMAVALVLAAAGATLQIIGPDRLKDLADAIAKGLPALTGGALAAGAIDMPAVSGIAAALVAMYVASALFGYVESFVMATVTARISRRLRTGISRKINRTPLKYFDRTSHGDVISRVTNDVDAIGAAMNNSLDTAVRAATLFAGSLVMMFLNSWIMALTAICTSLLGFFAMSAIVGKSQKHFVAQQRGLGDINGHIEEFYSGHSVVKAYNGGAAAVTAFEGYNGALYDAAWKSQFISGLMMPVMQFVGNLGYVAVCVVGAALAMGGYITFGVIVAFMMYVRLFTQPLSQAAQAFTQLQRVAAASERVFELFDAEELSDESGKKGSFAGSGDVEFRDVRFGYDADRPVINGFSAKVRPGQKVAIVGPTGAGKTTLVNLLMRFYEVDGGEIRLSGVPTNEAPRERLHEQFCMVLQDTWLFEGTVMENIAYGRRGITDDEVVAACKAVGVHRFICTLPDGYATVLSDKASLSAGQRQLIAIARAMVQDAPLLILDEATSSVDTRTERIVQAAMDSLARGRTSFVIAHRLSTIRNADLILVMRDGDIVESGTHDELLAGGGYYAEMYNSQFEPAA